MRTTFIAMCAVLIAALGISVTSMFLHDSVFTEMLELCDSAAEMFENDDAQGAAREIRRIKDKFEDNLTVLELVAHHDSLHDALAAITDAEVAFECGDIDDVHQALARLVGTLEHLMEHEQLTLANLT